MKKLKKGLLLMLAVFSVVSCKKYLGEKADKSLVVPATLSDLQALLDDAYYMNLVKTSSMPESSADDYFLTMDNYNNNDDNSRATYNWTLKEYFYSNDWSDAYVPVYNANVCLETIAGIPRTNANNAAWDNVKGSALFYRSYYYLNLVWEFAIAYDKNTAASDRGIVMRTGTDFNVKSFRSSVADSYTKIINDTRDAVEWLPDQPLNVLRPSKAAAYGLLTRAFLSMREYDSAYKYSNLFLQTRNVLLNYNTINVNAAVPFQDLIILKLFFIPK